jgi:hypothetical protein
LDLKREKKKQFLALLGRRLTFGSLCEAGPTCSRLRARTRPSSLVHTVPDHGRSRVPRGCHAPATVAPGRPVAPCAPRARLNPQRHVCLPLLHLICLPPLTSSSRACVPASATATVHTLAGVGRSSHHTSPLEPPSSSEHHLLFAQPVLALARSGIAPILGNCLPEIGPTH